MIKPGRFSVTLTDFVGVLRCYEIFWLVAAGLLNPCFAAEPWVTLPLSRGVSVDMPRNWSLISDSTRITVDASVKARTHTKLAATSEYPFAANLYDDMGKAIAISNIRYYPKQTFSQADARNANKADVAELNDTLREDFQKNGPKMGLTILRWLGTEKRIINGAVAFVTEYRRAAMGSEAAIPFRVRLVRILNESKSFTFTISYREDQEYLLRPICDHVIASLQIR